MDLRHHHLSLHLLFRSFVVHANSLFLVDYFTPIEMGKWDGLLKRRNSSRIRICCTPILHSSLLRSVSSSFTSLHAHTRNKLRRDWGTRHGIFFFPSLCYIYLWRNWESWWKTHKKSLPRCEIYMGDHNPIVNCLHFQSIPVVKWRKKQSKSLAASHPDQPVVLQLQFFKIPIVM